MLIVKGDLVVNMNTVVFMRQTGQGGKCLIFRGSDSLTAEMYFQSKDEADRALVRILEATADEVVNLDE